MAAEVIIQTLQSWYQGLCNGSWERGNGITIETLSTPGWAVTIDLQDTPLERRSMRTYSALRSDRDWIVCRVEHTRFHGEGDPQKLLAILHTFVRWASQGETLE